MKDSELYGSKHLPPNFILRRALIARGVVQWTANGEFRLHTAVRVKTGRSYIKT